jgi:hypothetical protein
MKIWGRVSAADDKRGKTAYSSSTIAHKCWFHRLCGQRLAREKGVVSLTGIA